MKLIIASGNTHKIREIKQILSPFFDVILSYKDAGVECEVEETGASFLDNARIKARAIHRLTRSGGDYAVLADDSGLAVEALDGRPGVFSARYAGSPCDDKKNNEKLLQELTGVKNRAAKYVCAVVLITPDGRETEARGEVCGEILTEYQGAGGFGYDPLFYFKALDKTFAALTAEEKNKISHRGRALARLAEIMRI